VVYGEDNRCDAILCDDDAWGQAALDSSVALIDAQRIDTSDPNNVTISAPTLREYRNLCPDEAFGEQPAVAYCSGTLIADALVLTAGHCIDDQTKCQSTRFVFGYAWAEDGHLAKLTSDDVFACDELLSRVQNDQLDYAVIRLDRSTEPRTPAVVRTWPQELFPEDELLVAGYPSGLPLKLAGQGWLVEESNDVLDYFIATLDSFAGNSGSGVYLRRSGELVGVLRRGRPDYMWDTIANCARVNRLPENQTHAEQSTYAFHAVEALCAVQPDAALCRCGDGICESSEATRACWWDCGTSCGDGVCNGDEDAVVCASDCGSCGNGVCELAERRDQNCCRDCACSDGFDCLRNRCVPNPLQGDSCDNAVRLPLKAQQTIQGDTTTAVDKHVGSCVPTHDPERVYELNLRSSMNVDLQVVGFDTVMYLRSECQDATSELDCNDDGSPPGLTGSRIEQTLPAGTYYIYVDGFISSGSYLLTVSIQNPAGCSDQDADGTCDSDDQCPTDPNKLWPGWCDCGLPDIDSDGDHVLDCWDGCPEDPRKIWPGWCGCGQRDPWLEWLSSELPFPMCLAES
jgi:V8-like Glu-specific endopeptidase